jgi:hypothetical protein
MAVVSGVHQSIKHKQEASLQQYRLAIATQTLLLALRGTGAGPFF